MKHLNMDILEKYIKAAEDHSKGTDTGDSKKTNSAYKRIAKIFRELKINNQLSLLLSLNNHENIGVKMWAATHLLPYKEEVGLSILSEIEKNHTEDLYGFDAKMTIQEWKKGNLTYLIE